MIQKLKAAFDFCCYVVHRICTTRYTLFLEAEVKRLTHDNDELWKALCKMRGTAPPAMIGNEYVPQGKAAKGNVDLSEMHDQVRKFKGAQRWPAMQKTMEAKSRAAAADLRRRAAVMPIRPEMDPVSATERIMEQAAPNSEIPLAEQDTSDWPEVAPLTSA